MWRTKLGSGRQGGPNAGEISPKHLGERERALGKGKEKTQDVGSITEGENKRGLSEARHSCRNVEEKGKGKNHARVS